MHKIQEFKLREREFYVTMHIPIISQFNSVQFKSVQFIMYQRKKKLAFLTDWFDSRNLAFYFNALISA